MLHQTCCSAYAYAALVAGVCEGSCCVTLCLNARACVPCIMLGLLLVDGAWVRVPTSAVPQGSKVGAWVLVPASVVPQGVERQLLGRLSA